MKKILNKVWKTLRAKYVQVHNFIGNTVYVLIFFFVILLRECYLINY